MQKDEMQFDFFVSYSQKDKAFVDALVHYLEADAIRCWYAPRDIPPGVSWPAAITHAMRQSGAMLLVFSESSNRSQEVAKEITLASNNKRLVVPVRIDDVLPNEEVEYHLANRHWLDVFGLEMEAAIKMIRTNLAQYVPLRDVPDGGAKTHDKAQARPAPPPSVRTENAPEKGLFARLPLLIGGLAVLVALVCGYVLLVPSGAEKSAPAAEATPGTGGAASQAGSGHDAADQLDHAQALLRKGKTAEAFGILERLAAGGDAEAQNLLGDIHYSGSGGRKSYEKAVHWYTLAAERDNAKACYSLACLYYDGSGVAKNYSEAMRWFLRAANRGDSAACFAIGEMYENGKGVNRNMASAYAWYMKAAEAGDAGAQYKVGVMLYEGTGTPENREQGLRWLYQAAENGEQAAEEYLQ